MAEADDPLILAGAYQDGELSAQEAVAFERRLDAEPELRAVLDRLGGVSGPIRATLADVPVPAGLHERAMLKAGAAPQRRLPGFSRSLDWRALAACLMLGFGLGGLFGGGAVFLAGRGSGTRIDDAILAGHLRGLAAPEPFDIASSDRHVVKPWFNGRTTIAPSAPDLADKGFPLIGGRIDVIDGRPVPTLVYRRDKHVISVTTVPHRDGPLPAETHRDGSTILAWTAGDLAYYVTSDLNSRDLNAFAELFRQRM